MQEYFLHYLNTSVAKLDHLFDRDKLNRSDIDSLNSCISMLEMAKNTSTL